MDRAQSAGTPVERASSVPGMGRLRRRRAAKARTRARARSRGGPGERTRPADGGSGWVGAGRSAPEEPAFDDVAAAAHTWLMAAERRGEPSAATLEQSVLRMSRTTLCTSAESLLLEHLAVVEVVLDAMDDLLRLPALEPLLPPPGSSTGTSPGAGRRGGQVDPLLERIRNLLAEAESTSASGSGSGRSTTHGPRERGGRARRQVPARAGVAVGLPGRVHGRTLPRHRHLAGAGRLRRRRLDRWQVRRRPRTAHLRRAPGRRAARGLIGAWPGPSPRSPRPTG